ncbi:MAG: AmmeMemoRadiSam system radical SAM enzyme [Acidobacteria bacterium]|nr:AmmeMemoRadiSam system radical SAM enzyme [Acidobacteriota bacterium]
MKEAILYHRLDSNQVICDLCVHRCRIRPGRRGVCGVRVNKGGTLYTLVYDRVAALEVDPVEKKPFFHFQPGSLALSIAAVGCNMRCLYCQNHHLSQLPKGQGGKIIGDTITLEDIVKAAQIYRCRSIAYTYTEPTIFFELAYDTACLAKAQGLKNLFVTNGYMTQEALEMIRPYLDGASVDLKGFNDKHYRRVCGARLQPVLDNIRLMHEMGVWVEVTTLIVPGLNDSVEELHAIAEALASISYSIPWHVSGFFPAYKMSDRPPTPVETIQRAYTIGRNAGLHYVYCGNIPGDICTGTYCSRCRTKLIQRCGFTVVTNRIVSEKCPNCGTLVDGIEMSNHVTLRQTVSRIVRRSID